MIAAATLSVAAACRPPVEADAPRAPGAGCGTAATPISAIQGSGDTSPLAGRAATIEAIVTAEFHGADRLGGFFVQQEDSEADGNVRTSEALFIAAGHEVRAGDRVRVSGTVAETDGRTGLDAITGLSVCARGRLLPAAVELALPRAGTGAWERFENMRVALAGSAVITDVYSLWRFGEFSVAGNRHLIPTQNAAPGRPAQAVAARQALDELIVDDGAARQNAPVAHAGENDREPFAADNPIRAGQAVSGLGGVLHEAYGSWRLVPTQPFRIDEQANPRIAVPTPVGGTLRIASFNLLNYFATLAGDGPRCGPRRNRECRGADTSSERARQVAKTVAALRAIDADVVAVLELENDTGEALASLVRELNAAMGPGTYAPIETGIAGQDAIRPGLIYRPARVAPVASHALLTRAADARFDDRLNRPALAQTFCERASGARFTLAAVHLKSKGSPCDAARDPDTGDGQANCNRTRTTAAAALADWLDSDPTETGTELRLIVGDLNAYALEDPIAALRERGYRDQSARYTPGNAYTFTFEGMAGQLDYALANAALERHVTGAIVWHINADESPALDYNEEYGKPAAYYRPDPFRSSDHDPVIVGLDFSRPAPRVSPSACP